MRKYKLKKRIFYLGLISSWFLFKINSSKKSIIDNRINPPGIRSWHKKENKKYYFLS
jgi:hypothetical protein